MGDREMYAQRGFSSRVGFGSKPALLIIDLIKGFTDRACPLGSDLDAEVEATARLLAEFRAGELPVHFTTTAYGGCTTSGCVPDSAVDGSQHGLRTNVVRECVGDRSAAAHEANLNDLDAKYADVIEFDAALNYVRSL